jgi:hypothetical protein
MINDAWRIARAALSGSHQKLLDAAPIMLIGRCGINIMVPDCEVFVAIALHGREAPVWMALTTRGQPTTPPGWVVRNNAYLRTVTDDSACAQFILYYEAYGEWVKSQAAHDTSRLPPVWGFARLVRNAIGHGNQVTINNLKAPDLSWRGITYGPSSNGRKIFEADFTVVELYILMIDMDAELQKLGYDSQRSDKGA